MESTGREFSYEGYKRAAFQCFPLFFFPQSKNKRKRIKGHRRKLFVISVVSRLPEHFLSSSARGMGLLSMEVTAERDIIP